MTESARREPIDDSGLEGHTCYRLYLRRSDLFHRHATLPLQPLEGTLFSAVDPYAATPPFAP